MAVGVHLLEVAVELERRVELDMAEHLLHLEHHVADLELVQVPAAVGVEQLEALADLRVRVNCHI